MSDLTEQWKKGELPSGFYYVKNEFGNIFPSDYSEEYDSINDAVIKDFFTEISEITEVIAPVPTYKEWQASEKYNKHLEEKIKIYERKDKRATKTSIAYNELAKENEELKEILERHKKATAKAQIRSCDLEIINAQLKELLKECLEVLKMVSGETIYFPRTVDECIDKINQALGEDK